MFMVRRIWEATHYLIGEVQGPVALLRESMKDIGWEWPSPFHVCTADSMTVDIRSMSPEEWGHLVREALRQMVWKQAAQRRWDMEGLDRGVDRTATQALLHSDGMNAYDKG